MRWEETLLGLFEDLEQQAQGLQLMDRDAEVAERSRAEYARVDLASRFHASVGGRVALGVLGIGTVTGSVARVGADWCLLDTEAQQDWQQDWVVRLAAVRQARGLSPLSVSEGARSVVTRLGLGSVLREVAQAGSAAVVHHVDGAQTRGRLGRVGADFAELHPAVHDHESGSGEVDVVPFGLIAAVRPG